MTAHQRKLAMELLQQKKKECLQIAGVTFESFKQKWGEDIKPTFPTGRSWSRVCFFLKTRKALRLAHASLQAEAENEAFQKGKNTKFNIQNLQFVGSSCWVLWGVRVLENKRWEVDGNYVKLFRCHGMACVVFVAKDEGFAPQKRLFLSAELLGVLSYGSARRKEDTVRLVIIRNIQIDT